MERMLPFIYDNKKRIFFDSSTGKQLISISRPTKPHYEGTTLAPRCLWTIPIKKLDHIRIVTVIKLADSIYTNDAYSDEGIEIEESTVEQLLKKTRMELKQVLELQMQLKAEQRPILSLGGEGAMYMRMELRQILGLYYSIVRMNEDELLEFIVQHTEQHGEGNTVQVLNFALAGKIKRVKPELTWKEAREMAKKLANSTPE